MCNCVYVVKKPNSNSFHIYIQNIIEWTGAGIYSAMFNIMTMLDFPYMPHIEVNPATVRTTNVEAHLAIYPFLQKVSEHTLPPLRTNRTVDIKYNSKL